jgi:hypothetical protein
MSDDLSEREKKAFDFAQEATKQLIALSTGVIALTITFLKDVVKKAPRGSATYIHAAWLLYLASIVFGIVTLLALTGSLGSATKTQKKKGKDQHEASIYAVHIRVASALQIVSFLSAVALTLVFGIRAT